MKLFALAATITFAVQGFAQTTTPTPEQASALLVDFESLFESLTNDPTFYSIGSILKTYVPPSAAESVLDGALSQTGSGIPYSQLTESITDSWLTYLPTNVRSEVQSFVTSLAVAEQSMVTSELSFTAPNAAATSLGAASSGSRMSGASALSGSDAAQSTVAWGLGLAAGAIGLAAAML